MLLAERAASGLGRFRAQLLSPPVPTHGGTSEPVPATRLRLLCALIIGVLSAGYVIARWPFVEPPPGYLAPDFDHLWGAARALRNGHNPYLLVGPGRAIEWPWQLYYPLPAVMLVVPLTYLPLVAARAAFIGIGSALLAFALTQRGWRMLLVFTSVAYYHAVLRVQWSPYLVAALLLPWLGGLFAVKPTIGAALWISRPTRTAVIGGLALVALSILVQPRWPLDWLGAIQTSWHLRAPVTLMGGFLVALVLLRWRRPEARLTFALGCVPQTTVLYDTLPLMLVPRTTVELGVLVLCTHVTWYVKQALGPYDSWGQSLLTGGHLIVLLIYLPAVFMILRRPNEGTWFAWRVPLRREKL